MTHHYDACVRLQFCYDDVIAQDLVNQTYFPEMDYSLGAPRGPAVEGKGRKGKKVWYARSTYLNSTTLMTPPPCTGALYGVSDAPPSVSLSRSHSATEFMLTCAITMTRNNKGREVLPAARQCNGTISRAQDLSNGATGRPAATSSERCLLCTCA